MAATRATKTASPKARKQPPHVIEITKRDGSKVVFRGTRRPSKKAKS